MGHVKSSYDSQMLRGIIDSSHRQLIHLHMQLNLHLPLSSSSPVLFGHDNRRHLRRLLLTQLYPAAASGLERCPRHFRHFIGNWFDYHLGYDPETRKMEQRTISTSIVSLFSRYSDFAPVYCVSLSHS